ncbi:MAG TPA: DUF6454 family protein [Candidatus Brocadiia bacterium]|nr:DUF6454 family protein [Candidatus Brocadiia bacterium]
MCYTSLGFHAGLAAFLLAGVCLASEARAADPGPGTVIAERFRALSRGSRWTRIKAVPLQFDTFHPQGMTRVGDRFFLSSVDVVSRIIGQGRGHLFEFREDGSLVRDARLGEGAMYHPGGIDWDGDAIWVSVAEYRPDSSSVVYRVNPDTFQARRLFTFPDHLGAITHDAATGTLFAVSWGSRRFYTWKTEKRDGEVAATNPDHPTKRANGSHYVDFQDVQGLPGTPYILCSGLSGYRPPEPAPEPHQVGKAAESPAPTLDILTPKFTLGGIEMLDVRSGCPVHQVPITLWTEKGRIMTQNPFLIEASGAGLRAYFIPDDNRSIMYVYEVEAKPEP